MLTKDAVLKQASEKGSQCIDGRDFGRLADFFQVSDWKALGIELKDGIDPTMIPAPKEWTLENILKQMASDVAFGFEKALNRRGISSSLMYEVVKMWLWVLEDDLATMEDYAQYGLPLFKAVAVKYGFPNEIGDDNGDEFKYSADSDRY